MSDIPKFFLELLKLSPRYLVAPLIFCSILLFSPDNILQRLDILEQTKNYKPIISLIFLACSCIFFTVIPISLYFRYLTSKKNKGMEKRLRTLTEDEKEILRFYIMKNTRTSSLRCDDGVVNGLEAVGIIYRTSRGGYVDFGMPYNISEHSWEYLKANTHLLRGESGRMRHDSGPTDFSYLAKW